MKKPVLSRVVQEQARVRTPLGQSIEAGVDPAKVISFASAWADHESPALLMAKYAEICADRKLFHSSGGYTEPLGDMACREALAEFERREMGVDVSAENVAVGLGSTQILHNALVALCDPGEDVVLFDPTYANYYIQMVFALTDPCLVKEAGVTRSVPGAEVAYLPVLDVEQWRYMPEPSKALARLEELCKVHNPRMLLFQSPDNPTGQVVKDKFVGGALELCEERGMFLVINMAYEAQLFGDAPKYYSLSPEEHPSLVTIHPNNVFGHSLGRRFGWLVGSKEVVEAVGKVQHATALCPDALHQMAMTSYLRASVPDGSLRKYLSESRELTRKAADAAAEAIDKHLGMRHLKPDGGIYTVMDVGMDSEQFVADALRNASVLFAPGKAFGNTLERAVRVSYGPFVNDHAKLEEGFERLGKHLSKKGK
ncbi:MAG: pyridoxal phosphate-dependent aminotransferase [Euryarchaeota archaeon]|nr:pyridoxal phosphate-dependent aminotransferase [Euryarchaeota archaeon]